MSTRRRSRECALQILYGLDMSGALTRRGDGQPEPIPAAELQRVLVDFWSSFQDGPVDRVLTERLVRGVLGQLQMVDEAIGAAAKGWRVERMAAVDRNLMRVAAYEIRACPDIPVGVSINEALEVAKRFSGKESARFINGVLDQLAKQASAEEPAGSDT